MLAKMIKSKEMINFTRETSIKESPKEYENKAVASAILINIAEPIRAAITAGTPNFKRTSRFALRPTSIILKRLLKKCTTPVRAMESSTGKKNMNTGVRIVPNPKPEKKVKIATKKAITETIMISIMEFIRWVNESGLFLSCDIL